MIDQTENFVRSTTVTELTDTDTEVTVSDASIFPDPTGGEYNVVIWNVQEFRRPDEDNGVEVCRVTNIDGDELTLDRAQEDTSASNHPSNSAIIMAPTSKLFQDIGSELEDLDNKVRDKADDPHGNESHTEDFATDSDLDGHVTSTEAHGSDGDILGANDVADVATSGSHNDLSGVDSDDHHTRFSEDVDDNITDIPNRDHNDLQNISSDDHHSRYTDGEAVSAADGEVTETSTTLSGLDFETDSHISSNSAHGADGNVLGANDVADVATSGSHNDLLDVDSDDHHTRFSEDNSDSIADIPNRDYGDLQSREHGNEDHDTDFQDSGDVDNTVEDHRQNDVHNEPQSIEATDDDLDSQNQIDFMESGDGIYIQTPAVTEGNPRPAIVRIEQDGHDNGAHSEDFAIDGDAQPPEEHGNEAHSEDFETESGAQQRVDNHSSDTSGVHGVGTANVASTDDVSDIQSSSDVDHDSTQGGTSGTPHDHADPGDWDDDVSQAANDLSELDLQVDTNTSDIAGKADDPHGNESHTETFAVDGDTQPPENHAASHETGGSDEIDHDSLVGGSSGTPHDHANPGDWDGDVSEAADDLSGLDLQVDTNTSDIAGKADDPHGNEAHSEDFAVDGDAQPPESHGNEAHDEDFATDSDLNGHIDDSSNPHNVTLDQARDEFSLMEGEFSYYSGDLDYGLTFRGNDEGAVIQPNDAGFDIAASKLFYLHALNRWQTVTSFYIEGDLGVEGNLDVDGEITEDENRVVVTDNPDGYEIQKDGTDGPGIINFKTE